VITKSSLYIIVVAIVRLVYLLILSLITKVSPRFICYAKIVIAKW